MGLGQWVAQLGGSGGGGCGGGCGVAAVVLAVVLAVVAAVVAGGQVDTETSVIRSTVLPRRRGQ